MVFRFKHLVISELIHGNGGIEMTKKKKSWRKKYNQAGYVFVLPWILGFLFLMLIPLIQTVQFAFSEVNLGTDGYKTTLIGIENFIYAFVEDGTFPKILVDSILDMLVDVPMILVFSFFVAVLLRDKFKGSGFVKGIFFITVIMSSGVFILMQAETSEFNTVQITSAMNSTTGIASAVNSISLENWLLEMGISETVVGYIATPVNSMFDLMTRSGIQIFIFLAGMSSISPALYEACSIEGATAWETFWLITFPMTSPLIVVNLIYTIVDSFMASDNKVLNYIYEQAFEHVNFGYSSALSWIYFLIVGIIIGLATWIISKKVVYHT